MSILLPNQAKRGRLVLHKSPAWDSLRKSRELGKPGPRESPISKGRCTHLFCTAYFSTTAFIFGVESNSQKLMSSVMILRLMCCHSQHNPQSQAPTISPKRESKFISTLVKRLISQFRFHFHFHFSLVLAFGSNYLTPKVDESANCQPASEETWMTIRFWELRSPPNQCNTTASLFLSYSIP
jgi:hypothetical protein